MSILIKPHITEKAASFATKGQYIFIVHKKANKPEIKKELERQYKVKIQQINTTRQIGKKVTRYTRKNVHKGEKSLYKKAIITLKKGETLDLQSQTL